MPGRDEASAARKESKPENSATEMAVAMGIELLTEGPHRALQQLGEFGVGHFLRTGVKRTRSE